MSKIPNGRDRSKTQATLPFDHGALEAAHAALAAGTKLRDLPDRLLFALAPKAHVSKLIESWLTEIRRAPPALEADQ